MKGETRRRRLEVGEAPRKAEQAKRVAIVGLPNSGKTQLFNDLTGSHELVANYPLTTVEVKRQVRALGDRCFAFVDTPGLHGLYVQSEEELVTRDLILREAPELLIQCVDSNRFKESLLLTCDLTALGIPMILVLTAVGESAQRGVRLDAERLSGILGVPVIESPAPGAGASRTTRAILGLTPAPPPLLLAADIEKAICEAQGLLPDGCPFARESALLLLEEDPTFLDFMRRERKEELREGFAGSLRTIRNGLAGKAPVMIEAAKSRRVDEIAREVCHDSGTSPPGFSETFARLCRHPVFGLPILTVFLGVLYLLVVYVAGGLSLLLTLGITNPVVSGVTHLLPEGFARDLLIGPYGLLTLGLFNSITTVLPILSVFFLVFGLLEDIGYLPNLAILTKRLSETIGLTGNAVIPLVLGFGCKTMATMSARTLGSRKERIIVVSLIAFAIPCSALTGLSIAILGQHGMRYFILAFACLAVAEVAAGLVLNRLIPQDNPGQFIQELPPIRLPRASAVAAKTGYRLLWFLREAIPIFLVASVAMFAIDKLGILGLLKQALSPIITGFLGLPLQMVDALLLTFARAEAAAGFVYNMARSGTLNGLQSVVAVVLLTTFSQCFANIAAMFKELGWRAALIVVLSVYVLSFLYSGAVHGFLLLVARVLGI